MEWDIALQGSGTAPARGTLLVPRTRVPGDDRARAVELFTEHREALCRFLIRFTGDPELAEDIAQDVYIRLVERPPQSAAKSWLFRVATNLARDAGRARQRRRRLLLEAGPRLPHGEAPAPPDEALYDAERRRTLERALAELSDKERTALLMREEGFKHHEIAAAVGTTTGSVGTLLVRAIRKLSDRIEIDREDL